MGIKINMIQNVCGMGCFLTKKSHVRQQYLQKVLELCGMGALSGTPITEKTVWGHLTLCGKGGKSETKVHTIWVFSNFHF